MSGCSRVFARACFLPLILAIACGGEGFTIAEPDSGPVDGGEPHDSELHDSAMLDVAVPDDSTVGEDSTVGGDSMVEDGGTSTDRCEPHNPCRGECSLPWLLATAQDVLGAGRCGGRVLRYALSPSGGFCACSSYVLNDDNPTTVSYVPGGTVVVGTQQNAFTFGGARMERSLNGSSALDTFVVEGKAPGSPAVGVLVSGRIGGGQAPSALVFGSDGSFEDLGLREEETRLRSNFYTQNPANQRGFRASDLNRPSVNRIFWEGGVEDLMHFAMGSDGPIEAFFANGFHRTVVSRREGIRHVSTRELTINHSPAELRCAGAEYEDCEYAAATPDPFSEHHVYVACEQPIEERRASRIARLDTRDDRCEDVLPFEHWRRIRITSLSVGLEDYWAP